MSLCACAERCDPRGVQAGPVLHDAAVHRLAAVSGQVSGRQAHTRQLHPHETGHRKQVYDR